jgi:hypothetical protein
MKPTAFKIDLERGKIFEKGFSPENFKKILSMLYHVNHYSTKSVLENVSSAKRVIESVSSAKRVVENVSSTKRVVENVSIFELESA